MKVGNELLRKETGTGRGSSSMILATVCASIKTTRAEETPPAEMPPTNRAAFKRRVTQPVVMGVGF